MYGNVVAAYLRHASLVTEVGHLPVKGVFVNLLAFLIHTNTGILITLKYLQEGRGKIMTVVFGMELFKLRSLLLVTVVLLSMGGVQGQVLTVQNGATGKPLEYATVVSDNRTVFLTTDSAGKVSIDSLEGAAAIEIRHIGFRTASFSYDELGALDFLVALAPTHTHLGQIVVSANRWEQPRRDAPQRIASLSAESVSLSQPATAADMLALTGEVFIQKSQQGGGSPMIRGFSTNRLLYAVDGVRMNTAIFRSGNLQNVISLNPFVMDHAEVCFGPGSVIYGSDAIGGVMAFETLEPRLRQDQGAVATGRAIARYRTANEEKTIHLDAQAGGRRWAFLTSFTHNDYGDVRMGRNGPDDYLRPSYVRRIDGQDVIVANDDPLLQIPNAFSQFHLLQKVRFMPNKDWDVQYALHYSATTDYDRYDRLLQTRNGQPRSAEWYYGPQRWMMNLMEINHTRRAGMYDQLSLRFAYQHFEESRVDRSFRSTDRRTRLERVGAWSANIDLRKRLLSDGQFYYGLEAVYNDVQSRGQVENIATGSARLGPARYPNADWSAFGAYLRFQQPLNEHWQMAVGARYTHYRLEADFSNNLDFFPLPFTTANLNSGAFTGNLGAIFQPDTGWRFRFNVATGFRAPNVDDIGKVFDSEPGAVVVPNPDLEAEYVYNAEWGMEKQVGDWMTVDLSCYYTWLDNALVRRDFQLDGRDSILYDGELSQVQAVQNAARAQVYGAQLALYGEWPFGLGFHAHVNYQEGKEELDDGRSEPGRHVAPWFGQVALHYQAERLRFDLFTQFNGSVPFKSLAPSEREKTHLYAADAEGNPHAPAWWTLNGQVRYQAGERWFLQAAVENLLDKRYRPYSSGLAAPGRDIQLSVGVQF